MKNNFTIEKRIESEIESYFRQEISRVKTPPAPLEAYRVYQTERKEEMAADPFPFQRRAGFYLLRAAAAAILITGGTAVFSLSKSQNEMAEIIAQISEQENMEVKVITGLQKAGRFLYLNL